VDPERRFLRWCRHPDRLVVLALLLGSAGLYLATLCRTVFWYDSAEYVAAALTLGIPHPPGYPLYTLLAHLFTRLPLEPAAAVNLMSACCSCLAVALAYLFLRGLGIARLAAAVGAGFLGASKLFWFHALIAEVYNPALAVILGVLLLLQRGLARQRPRLLVAAGLAAGLGLGIHLSIATCGLGFAVLVLGRGIAVDRLRDLVRLFAPPLRSRLFVAAASLLAAAAGSCIFLYLPLRARMKPVLNFGDPVTWERFLWHITGGNYGRLFDRGRPAVEQWRWLADSFLDQLGAPALLLAGLGVGWLARRAPLYAVALLLMMAGNLWFFFGYGAHDQEVFFLPSTLVLALCAGAGVDALLVAVARIAAPQRRRLLVQLASIAVAALPALLGVGHYRTVDMSGFTEARDFGERLVRELPQGAALVTFTTPPEWKYDAVFGFFMHQALGLRPDVALVTAPRPADLAALVRAGRPTYLYLPLDFVVRGSFVVEPEGALFRISGLRPGRR
jgi:hypothetical protein